MNALSGGQKGAIMTDVELACSVNHIYREGYEQGKKDGMKWNPCSERFPEETGRFLVCYKSGDISVAKYGYNTTHKYKCFWAGYVRAENIIAWQPLPEPYKEGEE